MEILYQDDACVVAVKPAGMLSEAGEGSFPEALEKHLSAQGQTFTLYAVHRLDRAVSGVMVYAKTKAAAARLSSPQALKGKTYLTVVRGRLQEPSATLTDYLFKDSRKNKVFVVKSLRKGAKEAVLSYRVLAYDQKSDLSLLSVTLQTGRSHQIRVQLASRKHPVLGDGKYGGGDNAAKQVALFSAKLCFTPVPSTEKTFGSPTPSTEKTFCSAPPSGEKSFCAAPPDAYPFSLFKEAIVRFLTVQEK